MKNTPYKENSKNCSSYLNKLRTTPINLHKNLSNGQFLFSDSNINSLKHSQNMVTHNEILTQEPYINFFNVKKPSEDIKFEKISIPPILHNEEKNNFINFNPKKKQISNSKSGLNVLRNDKQFSFLDNLLKLQNKSGNLLNLSRKNYPKNLKCNRTKQYSISITDNKQNEILKYYQRNKGISQSSSHYNKNKNEKYKSEKYIKFSKIKNNSIKHKIQKYTTTNVSINNNHIFRLMPNFIHRSSKNDINNSYQCFCSKTKTEKNNIFQSEKNNMITSYKKITDRNEKVVNTSLINEIVNLQKAIDILQLYFKEKYFYYFIEKFLLHISGLFSDNESKNFSITHESSTNSGNKNKEIITKYPSSQIFTKQSVNSFKINNNNSKINCTKIDYEMIAIKLKELITENKKLNLKRNMLSQENRDLAQKLKSNKNNSKIFTKLSFQNVNKLNIKSVHINYSLYLKKICIKNIFLIINNHFKILLLNIFQKLKIQGFIDKKKKVFLSEDMIKLREIKLKKIMTIKEKIYKRIFLKYFMKFYFAGLFKYMNNHYGNKYFKTFGRLININASNSIMKLIKLRKVITIKFKFNKNILRKNFFIFYSRGIIFKAQKFIFSPLKNQVNNNNNFSSKITENCYIQELIEQKKLRMKNILKKLINNKGKNIFITCKTDFIKWQCKTKIISIIEEDKAKKKRRRIQKKINKKNAIMKSEEMNNKNKKKINTSNNSKSYGKLQTYNSLQLINFVQKIMNIYKIYFFKLLKKQKENKSKNNTIKEEKRSNIDDEIDFYIEDSSVLSGY